MINGKDYLLRSLAIGAYLIAFYFSWVAWQTSELKEMYAWIWGCASLIYWWITLEFEKRDHNWKKEDKE